MGIRDVLNAALSLKAAFDSLEALQLQRDQVLEERQRLIAEIDAQQIVVNDRKAALKAAAATL